MLGTWFRRYDFVFINFLRTCGVEGRRLSAVWCLLPQRGPGSCRACWPSGDLCRVGPAGPAGTWVVWGLLAQRGPGSCEVCCVSGDLCRVGPAALAGTWVVWRLLPQRGPGSCGACYLVGIWVRHRPPPAPFPRSRSASTLILSHPWTERSCKMSVHETTCIVCS